MTLVSHQWLCWEYLSGTNYRDHLEEQEQGVAGTDVTALAGNSSCWRFPRPVSHFQAHEALSLV